MQTKPLKHMTAGELDLERSRHRRHIGHLALQRMRDDLPPSTIAEFETDLLKRRRRVVRLERRIAELTAIASRPSTPADFEWRDLPLIPESVA